MVQNHLLFCSLYDVLLHGAFRDESIYIHLYKTQTLNRYRFITEHFATTVLDLIIALPVSFDQSYEPWPVPAGHFEDSNRSRK